MIIQKYRIAVISCDNQALCSAISCGRPYSAKKEVSVKEHLLVQHSHINEHICLDLQLTMYSGNTSAGKETKPTGSQAKWLAKKTRHKL